MLRDSEKRRIYDQVSSCLYWALLLGAVHGVFMPDSVWCCACSAATFKQVASMTRSAAAAGCSALEVLYAVLRAAVPHCVLLRCSCGFSSAAAAGRAHCRLPCNGRPIEGCLATLVCVGRLPLVPKRTKPHRAAMCIRTCTQRTGSQLALSTTACSLMRRR